MDGLPLDWILEMPPVTRMWIFGIAFVSVCEQFQLLDQFQLLYSYSQAVQHREYWRFVTCFLYFGELSINLVLNTYFLIKYSQMLEESFSMKPVPFPFKDEEGDDDENSNGNENNNGRDKKVYYERNKLTEFINMHNATLEYLWMLIVVSITLLVISTRFQLLGFLGPMLSNSITYVWARRNPGVNLSFLGAFVFSAPYLPWVMLLCSAVTSSGGGRGQVMSELIAIAIGHVYFFLEDVYPRLYNDGKRVLTPPWSVIAKELTTKPVKDVSGKCNKTGITRFGNSDVQLGTVSASLDKELEQARELEQVKEKEELEHNNQALKDLSAPAI